MTPAPQTNDLGRIGTPILVCGHPKSGTTLVSTLLDGHSEIVAFPEETFYLNQLRKQPQRSAIQWGEWLLEGRACQNLALGEVETELDGNFDYSEFNFDAFADQFRNMLASDPILDNVLPSLMQAYAAQTETNATQYWLEKTPGNEYSLERVSNWYRNIRPIYVMRDPRDVYVSYSRKKERESEGDYALPVEDFICRWGLSLSAWHRYTQLNNGGLVLRYEELVTNPESTMRQVCSYLDLPFEEALTLPTKGGTLWQGNSMHGDRFNGVDTKPVGRWRDSLSAETVDAIEGFLGPAMRRYGYELSGNAPSAFSIWRRWMGTSRRKKRMLGTLLGLYTPDILPKSVEDKLAP